ncbi:RraA family protein [Haladaptatus pallidirubidus]|uniref:4-hydroxy-4-methyl-2-oxoglutarate aldolase n=1 Tax=Haladaptatus pallidirubidus TaxID=1008152 RepID=A0AAV3US72_9EURY|nr:RraA family protein [Haladaptatus pallidirubidus]
MVINNLDRPDEELVEQLGSISPNDVGHHLHFGFPSADVEYMNTGPEKPLRIAGPALTVRIPPEDSTMVHKATELAQEGDVIVVDMQGHTENAPWGEMTTRGAMASGAIAAVVDGTITDSRDISELDFPVFARGRSARTTRLHGRGGDINVPVQVGGTVVEPGDIVLMNEDGILFVDSEEAERALEHGKKALEHEAGTVERIENGESIAEISDANDLVEEMQSH